MVQEAGGHYWTTGAVLVFMGALGLLAALVIVSLSPELLGFIRFEAFLTIAASYLGLGGYLVATNWNEANRD